MNFLDTDFRRYDERTADNYWCGAALKFLQPL